MKKTIAICGMLVLLCFSTANSAVMDITNEADPYVITLTSSVTDSYDYTATSLHGLKITGSLANYTMNGAITGNVRLIVDYGTGATKNNSARLLLNNAGNTFDGGIQLTTGTLRYGSTNGLGSGAIDFDGGVLMSGANGIVTNNMTLASGSWGGLRGSLGITVTGQISGDGDLVIVTDGQPITLMNTANNYTGVTSVGTVQGGTNTAAALTLGADNVLPATTVLEIRSSQNSTYNYKSANAVVNLNGKTNTVAGLYGTGALNGSGTLNVHVAEGKSYTFSGTFTSSPSLNIGGAGTQVIESAADFTLGKLTLGTGTLQLEGAASQMNVSSLVLAADSTALDLNGKNLTITGINVTGNTHAGKVTNTAETTSAVTLTYKVDETFDTSFLTGNTQLVLKGSSGKRMKMSFGQTFTGGILVSSGVVRPVNASVVDGTFLGATPTTYKADAIILDGGSIQNTDGNISIEETRGITVTENGGTLRMGFSATYIAAIRSVISGNGWFGATTDEGGTIELYGVNTYTGETRIGTTMNNSGASGIAAVVASMVDGALPTNTNVVFGTTASNLQLKGTTQTVGALISRENCQTDSVEGNVVDMGLISTSETATLTFGGNNASGIFTGQIANTSADVTKTLELVKTGTGTQVLGGTLANTRANLDVQGGVVELAKSENFAVNNLVITSGTVNLTGDSGNQINGTLTMAIDTTLNLNGKTELVSVLNSTGKANVDLAGGTLKAPVAYGTFNVTNSAESLATLNFTDGDASAEHYFYGVSGNIQVVKTGNGRQYFGGTNNYTGGTSIQNGILYTSTGGLGSGKIEFKNGATLMSGSSASFSNDILLTGNGNVRGGGGVNGTVVTLSGDISGSGKLRFNSGEGNGGSFVLSGNNDYTGGTEFLGTGATPTVSEFYTVTLQTDNALGTHSATVNLTSGKVGLIFDTTTGNRTIANDVSNKGKGLEFTAKGTNEALYSGEISGTGTFASTGVNYTLNLDELTENGASNILWNFDGDAVFSDETLFHFIAADPAVYHGKSLSLMVPGSNVTGLATAILNFADAGGNVWNAGFDALGNLTLQIDGSALPEPGTFGMLLLGLVVLFRRKTKMV